LNAIDRPCLASRRWFSDQLDGQPLPRWRGLVVRLHLAICPRCRRVARSLEATRDALSALRDADVER